MILAKNGIIPPKEWEHEKSIEGNDGEYVLSLLRKNNLKVPEVW